MTHAPIALIFSFELTLSSVSLYVIEPLSLKFVLFMYPDLSIIEWFNSFVFLIQYKTYDFIFISECVGKCDKY